MPLYSSVAVFSERIGASRYTSAFHKPGESMVITMRAVRPVSSLSHRRPVAR